MNRVRNVSTRRNRKKKMRKMAKGFSGSKHRLTKTIKEQLMRSLRHSYIGRKLKKRDFRSIWITRINIACREKGINYSKFIRLLKLSQIKINRKQISEIINNEPKMFDSLIEKISKFQNIESYKIK